MDDNTRIVLVVVAPLVLVPTIPAILGYLEARSARKLSKATDAKVAVITDTTLPAMASNIEKVETATNGHSRLLNEAIAAQKHLEGKDEERREQAERERAMAVSASTAAQLRAEGKTEGAEEERQRQAARKDTP